MDIEHTNAIDIVADLERLASRHPMPFDGGEVMWRRFGQGPHRLLFHGGHGGWLHWVRNILPLAEHFTVWVPDLPGYGDSQAPREPTLASLVDALEHTFDALLGPRTDVGVAGFSFGGLVAAEFACRRASVTHLALLGPAGHGSPRRPRGTVQSWRSAQANADVQAVREIMRHNLCVHMLAKPESADELAVRIHTDACLRTRFRSKPISRAGGLAERLDRRVGPLTMAWGEHDITATPNDVVSRLIDGHPDRRAVILPDAGHWVQYEAAEQVNALLLEALSI